MGNRKILRDQGVEPVFLSVQFGIAHELTPRQQGDDHQPRRQVGSAPQHQRPHPEHDRWVDQQRQQMG